MAIGESTCASKLWAAPVTAGGKACIEVVEMTRIGFERGKTVREVIQIMGDLATELGFYAADRSKGEGGEGLTVVDKTEAWVFHVTNYNTNSQMHAGISWEGTVCIVAHISYMHYIHKFSYIPSHDLYFKLMILHSS